MTTENPAITNDAAAGGEKSDEKELEYGLAAVYQPSDDVDLILELFGEYEKEKGEDGETERTNSLLIVPGVKYEFANELEVGIGVPVGLNDDSFDVGGILKAQYEFY